MTGASDPATVAAGLTEAQRKDLLASVGGEYWWSADGRTARGMQRKGLIETLNYTNSARLTPLGLAVRAELERNAP